MSSSAPEADLPPALGQIRYELATLFPTIILDVCTNTDVLRLPRRLTKPSLRPGRVLVCVLATRWVPESGKT